MTIQQCWTCVSVGRKEKSKYSQCSAGSREEEIFFLLEVCCENSDAAWQGQVLLHSRNKKQQLTMAQKLQGS